jgi:hypothetical protein
MIHSSWTKLWLKLSKSGEARDFYGSRGGETSAAISEAETIGNLLGSNDRNRNWTASGTDKNNTLKDIVEERSFKLIDSDGGGGEVDFDGE